MLPSCCTQPTSVRNVTRHTQECCGAVDEYDLTQLGRLGLRGIFCPYLQHGPCSVCSREVVFPHAAFQLLYIDVCDESNLRRGAAGYAKQNIWMSSLRSEDRIELFS